MLNGMVFSSENEFLESLGMKFKDSGWTYQTGDKKGKSIIISDINSKDDIPQKVIDYFDYYMEFLKSEVGEEKYNSNTSIFWWRYSTLTIIFFTSS